MKALDTLARLLATENLQVVRGNYSTASFDCEKRILRIPNWDFLGKDASDLFISHEVGHALWTPVSAISDFDSDPRLKGCPFSVINILEDIRIERMIQDKYPGLIAVYRRGYQQLQSIDLFKIKDVDLTTLGFFDRLNVYSKLKHAGVDIPMSESDMEIYRKAFSSNTFKDVLEHAAELWAPHRKEEKNEQSEDSQPSPSEQNDGDKNESSGSSDSEPGSDFTSSGGETAKTDESMKDAAEDGKESDSDNEAQTDGDSKAEGDDSNSSASASDKEDGTDNNSKSNDTDKDDSPGKKTNNLKSEDFNSNSSRCAAGELESRTRNHLEASGTVIVSSDLSYALKTVVIPYSKVRESRLNRGQRIFI